MRRRRLRHLVVRLRLHGVNEVREFHRVLDKEHWNIVTDQIPVPLIAVEFDGKSANVARGVGRAALSGYRRKSNKYRGGLACVREHGRAGQSALRFIGFEEAVSR